jgi:hypothetical protein
MPVPSPLRWSESEEGFPTVIAAAWSAKVPARLVGGVMFGDVMRSYSLRVVKPP